jgi:hypothetical protein
VLERHKQLLDPSISIDDPVKVIGKKRGIVDLMFSRVTKRHRANDMEHMVVELKAPSVKIGAEAITQVKKYAIAILGDERFHTVKGIKWHFWLVSNDYDEYARNEIETGPDPERRLIMRGTNVTVGIKSWGELIEENRARLQFFQEHLQHTADESPSPARSRPASFRSSTSRSCPTSPTCGTSFKSARPSTIRTTRTRSTTCGAQLALATT